jgi:tyrosine-specific transport protein
MKKYLFFEHEFARAAAILAGAIIGAGIFSVPFVFASSGILVASAVFAVVACIVLLLHLMFTEVVERTEGTYRLVGYASHYFGTPGKIVISISAVLGTLGALVAYLLVGSSFLSFLLAPFGVSATGALVGFWFVMALGIVLGMKSVARLDAILVGALVVLLSVLILWGAPLVEPSNLSVAHWDKVLVPFGVALFALIGFPVIPSIRDVVGTHGPRWKKAIFVGTLVPIALTYLFGVVVAGVAGEATSPEAIAGLVPFMGRGVLDVGAAVGLLAIVTSFFAFGTYLRDTLRVDWNIPALVANAITAGVPLALILAGATSIVDVLTFVGAVFGAVDGTMVVLLFARAKERGTRRPYFDFDIPTVIQLLVIAALVFGGVYSLLRIGVG